MHSPVSVRIVSWIDYRVTVERASCILLSNRIHIWNIPQSYHVLPCDLHTVNRWLTGRKSRHYADLFVYWLRLFSHHRLLTRGHDLAVLSITMPFSILETCHLIVNHVPAVRDTAPFIVTSTLSSSRADSYRLDRSIVYRACCILYMNRFLANRCSAHFCILIIKCVPSPAGKHLIHTSFMVRNVLIIAKGTLSPLYNVDFIVEYVISGPDNRSGEEWKYIPLVVHSVWLTSLVKFDYAHTSPWF